MANQFGDKLSDLDLTNDEVKRLSECMKDEKFMELLKDYAMEISDPANKKKYEEEISMMERERGNDVKFVNPTAGYVLKTSCNGKEKCFINICTSVEVGKPSCKPSVQDSSKGMQWSIPHSLSQPREDVDKSGVKCTVYDVVFNPDTCRMADKNTRFHKMVENIALDAIERNFSVNLDKVNIKRPKMKYKGVPQASIIRLPKGDAKPSVESQNPNDPLAFPYPPMSNGTVKSQNSHEQLKTNQSSGETSPTVVIKKANEYAEPKYTLIHRGYFDIKNYYAMSDKTVTSTRPRELILNVELPMLKSASSVELEISEDHINLECAKPVKYKLDLKLPFPVDDTKGNAKFDKSKHRLIITLEVLPPVAQQHPSYLPTEDTCESSDSTECHEHTEPNHIETPDSTDGNYMPTTHPSGLFHGQSKCRHENHGSLWDKPFEENTDDIEPSPLSQFSPSLIKILEESEEVEKHDILKKIRPQMFFHQDDDFVVFIVNIKNIDCDKLWYTVSSSDLSFSTMTDDKENEVYQLYITFNTSDKVDPQRSRVDISDDNAVFALRKHSQCLYKWQNFQTGFDNEKLTTKRFLTSDNMEELMSNVREEAQDNKNIEMECQVISESQNPKMLALKLIPKFNENSDQGKDKSSNVKDVAAMMHILKEIDDLNIVDDADSNVKQNAESQKQCGDDSDSDTDEDDTSTYNSAESDCEYKLDAEPLPMENNLSSSSLTSKDPIVSDTSLLRKQDQNLEIPALNKSLDDEDHRQTTTVPDTITDDNKQVNDELREKQPQSSRNEQIIVHEYEKGNETKLQVYNDHRTNSVVKLSNEMLFEIDSD